MMIQMADWPNTTPIDKKTLSFKVFSALFISKVKNLLFTYIFENERHSVALRKLLVVCTFAMGEKCLLTIGNNS